MPKNRVHALLHLTHRCLDGKEAIVQEGAEHSLCTLRYAWSLVTGLVGNAVRAESAMLRVLR